MPFFISQYACGDVRSIAWRGGEGTSQQRANPPAVDRDRSPSDVARSLRGEERGECGKRPRLAEAPQWDGLLPLRECRAWSVAGRARQLLDAVGARVSREQIVDRDSERSDLVRQCPREADHGGAQTVGEHEALDRLLGGN